MLIRMVEETTQDRNNLQCQNDQLTEQVDRLKCTLQNAEADLECMREAKAAMTCEMSALSNDVQKYSRRAEEAENENQLMGETLVEQEAQLTRVAMAADLLAEDNDGAEEELDCLRDKLRNALKELEDLCGCNKELEKVVSELKDELEHYKDTLVEAEAENQKKQRQIEALERQIQKMQVEIDDLTEQLDYTTSELRAAQEDLGICQEALEALKLKSAGLLADLDRCETTLQECEMEKSILEQKFESYKSNHNMTDEQYEQKCEEVRKMAQHLRECTLDREEKDRLLADMGSELQARTNELEENIQNVKLLKNEIDQSQQQLSDLQDRLGEVQEDRRKVIHEAELNFAQAQNEISELRRQLDMLEEELLAKDEDLKSCCSEVRKRDEELTQYRKERRQTANELAKLQADMQDQENELAQVVMDREKLKTDLSEACNMYNALAKRAENIETELDNAKERNLKMEKDNRELQGLLDECCRDKSFALQKVEKLENDLAEACREMERLASLVQEEQRKAMLALEKLKQMEEEIRKWEECVKKYQNKLREYDKYSSCLQYQLEKLQRQATLDDQRTAQEIRHMKGTLEREQTSRRSLEYDLANRDQVISQMRQKAQSQAQTQGAY